MEMREREDALGTLRTAFDRARSAGGQVAVVHGDAGIGKTSVVAAFLKDSRTHALLGRCDDTSVPTPLGPFRDVFRSAGSPDHHDPDGARDETARLLDRAPVMVIEDIHWADEASFDLLTHFCRRIDDYRSLIVLTHRPDGPPALTRCLAQIPSDRVTDIALAPLSLETVVGWAAEHGRNGEEVFAKTGGNPFLVDEVLASPSDEIPVRISTTTLARLSTLSDPARERAELLAQFPGGAPWPVIDALRPSGAEAAAELERHRWLDTRGDRVLLRHELIREAIAESIPVAIRRALNQEILDALIDQNAGPAAIAHHAAEAGHEQRSIDYAIVAAQQLSLAGAHHDALLHLERVAHLAHLLPDQERAQFVEALGLERMAADDVDGAYDAMMESFERWQALGDRGSAARALRQASAAQRWRGEAAQSGESLRRALALLDGTDHDLERFRTQITIGQNAGLTSNWHSALDALAAALNATDGVPDDTVAVAIAMRADARRLLGEESGALADYTRSLEMAEPTAPSRTTTLLNRVATSLAVLAPVKAAHHLADAERAARQKQSEHTDRFIAELRGGLEFMQGRWEEAIGSIEHLIDDPLTTRTRPALVAGLIRARRGDATGVDLVTEAHRRASALADIQRLGGTAAALAELLWLGLAPDQTADEIKAVTELAHRSGHARYSAELAVWCRRLGLDGGMANEAGPPEFLMEFDGEWEPAASRWAARGVPYLEVMALGFSGEEQAIRTAIEQATTLGAHVVADRLRAQLRDLGHHVRRGRSRTTLDNPGGLTNRQVDVVRLLAEGLTNQQIADRLFISPKTVDHHVSAILTALSVAGRAEAGNWAQASGLA